MASKFSLKKKHFLICVLVVSVPLMFFALSMKNQRVDIGNLHVEKITKPVWLDIIAKRINSKDEIKVGLVNIDPKVDVNVYQRLGALHPQVKTVSVDLTHIDENLKWEDFFPEWIDENEKWAGKPKCPHVPMPKLENYRDVNVVVAKVPCWVKDVFGLQVNLVVANLAVESGWVTTLETRDHRKVFVVFIGSCGPMEEIFRCNDLLVHEAGEFSVYMPDLWHLKQKTLMPVGSCQIAPGYAEIGQEVWRSPAGSIKKHHNNTLEVPMKYAYVTVLHSSEDYVCGAIALAQSIFQATKRMFRRLEKPSIDLLLLADKSIGSESIKGLKSAGWKIKRIERILSPFAKKGAYNEWNYNKLRIWELTMYDKIIFIDSDQLVFESIDDFFTYPQFSASPEPEQLGLFNLGLMIIEPSKCMFETMMSKTSKVKSYNGGDQGFLNEIFTWWHRLPSKLNRLILFRGRNENHHEVPEDMYTIHFLGLKPWMCYRDYDCNWDKEHHHIFASDSAHEKWWKVYDDMPEELQGYCGLTEETNEKIVEWRRKARNANLANGHWKIEIKDPRKKNYLSD